MRFITLLLGAVLVLGLAGARRADACGGGGPSGEIVAAALVVGGAYVGVTVGMGVKDIASDNHSVGYGIAETAIHAPIALLYGSALVAQASTSDRYGGGSINTGALVMTAVHTALAAHGIYTIAKDRKPRRKDQAVPPTYQGPPGMFQVGSVTASVTPTATSDSAGLGLTGSF
jgi:hypothetical protein